MIIGIIICIIVALVFFESQGGISDNVTSNISNQTNSITINSPTPVPTQQIATIEKVLEDYWPGGEEMTKQEALALVAIAVARDFSPDSSEETIQGVARSFYPIIEKLHQQGVVNKEDCADYILDNVFMPMADVIRTANDNLAEEGLKYVTLDMVKICNSYLDNTVRYYEN